MKAIISEELTRKSWSDKSVLIKQIIGTKDDIVNKVNNYISERISCVNKIPVKKFNVKILNHHEKEVNNWNYSPTYR